MLETGMRPEELYRLLVKNVNLKAGWLFNPHGKTKSCKTENSPDRHGSGHFAQEGFSQQMGRTRSVRKKNPNKPITQLNKPHGTAVKRSGVADFRLYDPQAYVCNPGRLRLGWI